VEIGTGDSLADTRQAIVISFQNPLWLILLIIIPLIRWLHQFRQQFGNIPCTTLFLWIKSQHHAHSNGIISRPDRQWLLRALITIVIILSLSEPFIQNQGKPSMKVWVDDSLSMFALEEQSQPGTNTSSEYQTRMQLAIKQLYSYLMDADPANIQLSSLSNPALTLRLEADHQSSWLTQLAEWTSRPRGEPVPPTSEDLSPEYNHILLTDGADKVLNRWIQTVPLQHVIRVGHSVQNIAITHLSLRNSLNQSASIKGIAQINNFSDTAQKIHFNLQKTEASQKTPVIKMQTVDIPASGQKILTFTIENGMPDSILASIDSANDALPLDDQLRLDTDKQLQLIRYSIQGQCSPYVMVLLNSQSSLVETNKTPDIVINCSARETKSKQPVLRLYPSVSNQQTKTAAHWHGNIGHDNSIDSLRIPAGLSYSVLAPPLTADAMPLLSADKRMLISRFPATSQRLSETIDYYLNNNDPLLTHQAEYPLLILGLIRQLTGHKTNTEPLSVSRDIAASQIRAIPFLIQHTSPGEAQSETTYFTHLLLYITLLLLLLDALLTFNIFQHFGKPV